MLIMLFKGFGGLPQGMTLWCIANFTLILTIYWERNAMIFEDSKCSLSCFSSSLWASTNEAFASISLSLILLDWNLILKPQGLPSRHFVNGYLLQ